MEKDHRELQPEASDQTLFHLNVRTRAMEAKQKKKEDKKLVKHLATAQKGFA